jgi:hypothetical protein
MKDPVIDIPKGIAKMLNAKGVIVLCFDDYKAKCVSYGITKKECQAMKVLLDDIYNQIESGKLPVWEK